MKNLLFFCDVKALAETLDAASRVKDTLLAGKERMAL
jgi:hypothetical protein